MATFTIGNFEGMSFVDSGLAVQSLEAYGISGAITNVSISLGGLRHTYSDDLDMVLSGPLKSDGFTNHFLFWSDVGGTSDLTGSDVTVTDAGGSALSDTSPAPSFGSWRPADYDASETAAGFGISGSANFLQAPPTDGYSFSGAFGSELPNGTWSLRVRDDIGGDTGGLDAWSLAIETNGSGVNIDGTVGADTIYVTLTGIGAGTYQMNGLPVIGFAGVTSYTLSGGGGADTISGSAGGEFIQGGADRDTIRAGGGGDFIYIEAGHDVAGETYDGGAGRDSLTYRAYGSATLNLRDDALASIEILDFGGPDDTDATTVIQLRAAQIGPGLAANATIQGTDTDPFFILSDRLDIVMETTTSLNLSGMTFTGFSKPGDRVFITGDADAERIVGSQVNDTLAGNAGADIMDGGAGTDTLIGGDGDDSLDGGSEADLMQGGASNDTYFIDNAGDVADESVAGSSGSLDAIVSSTLSLNLAEARYKGPIEVVALNGTLNLNAAGNGSANYLFGNSGNNSLAGQGGADILDGRIGHDNLFGGLGNDQLTGGAGNDMFVFDTALTPSANVDRITDFANASGNNDAFKLDDAVFTGLAVGGLASGAFMANTTGAANEGDDRIIYNTSNGALSFDRDGSGNTFAGVQFATVDTFATVTLTHQDFLII